MSGFFFVVFVFFHRYFFFGVLCSFSICFYVFCRSFCLYFCCFFFLFVFYSKSNVIMIFNGYDVLSSPTGKKGMANTVFLILGDPEPVKRAIRGKRFDENDNASAFKSAGQPGVLEHLCCYSFPHVHLVPPRD